MGNLLNKKVKCADAKRACPLQSRSQQWMRLSCTCSRKLHQKASAFMAQGSQTCFLRYIKGQLRSLRVWFHPRNSPSVPKPKIKLKRKKVTEGKVLQPIWHRLLKYVALDQEKCPPAKWLSRDPWLEKWYKSSLCLLQKSIWGLYHAR